MGIFFALIIFLIGCSGDPRPKPEMIHVSDEEARQFAGRALEEQTITLAEGLEVQLWASETLLGDVTAIHIDDRGQAWTAVTSRANSSEFDLRNYPEWEIDAVRMKSVEDRREFIRREFATERSEENRDRMPDRNNDGFHDWRDQMVEQEELWRIEDLTGNGLANLALLFYRDEPEEITQIATGVLHFNGDTYFAVAPNLLRLRDTNGDGMADWQESISYGYGVNITTWGHGMSGMTTGPDGRIYWAIGDPGFNVVDQDGNQWYHPDEGGILRSEPDGSNLEVFAAGLRNTHEFAFDKYGNIFSVDNDGNMEDEAERVVYPTYGSDSGWRHYWEHGKKTDPKNNNYNVFIHERKFYPHFEDQDALHLPALQNWYNGPAGMTYNPGPGWGEQWEDHFFITRFVGSQARSAVNAMRFEPKGASFELVYDEQILQGIASSSLSFGPDGALYIADWIEGWRQNNQSRIWKLDVAAEAGSAIRREIQELLKSPFDGFSGDALVDLMGHPDMRVRQKAQFEVVSRRENGLFLRAIESEDQMRRIHGIWGLGQLARQSQHIEYAEPLVALLDDNDPEIRTQVARTLGDIRFQPAADRLIELLADDEARVRYFATEALGRLAWEPAVEPIVTMLEENNDEDVYLRYGGAVALAGIGRGEPLADLYNHSSWGVRIAALIALHRLNHPGVARYLNDHDEFIVTNAARAINDGDLIEEALPDLSRMLDQDLFVNEPLIRRAINASLYSGTAADASRLAQFALRTDIPEVLRTEALATLRWWATSSVLDRVTGQYRGEVRNDIEDAHQALETVVARLFRDNSPDIRVAAVEMVGSLSYKPAVSDLVHLLERDASERVRVAALTALQNLEYEGIADALAIALESSEAPVRQAALEMMPELDFAEEDIVDLLGSVLKNGLPGEQQTALETLGRIGHPDAYELLGEYLERLIAGEIPHEIQLDILEAVNAAGVEALNRRVEEYHAGKPEDDPVATYRESLFGGDAWRGRTVFLQGGGACLQCHTTDGTAGTAGPDLANVGSRLSREQLLESLIDPSARITPGFGSVTVRLGDGQTVRGILEAENGTSITVSSGAQQSLTIQKSDIEERMQAPSAMPAMGNVLSRRELRDLVEYLTTLAE